MWIQPLESEDDFVVTYQIMQILILKQFINQYLLLTFLLLLQTNNHINLLLKFPISSTKMNPKFSTHRSVSLDVFDLKRRQQRYAMHLNKLQEIQSMKVSKKRQVKKIKEVTDQMHKTREISRKFRNKQEQFRRKKQDSKMLGNIVDRNGRKYFASGLQKQEVFLHSNAHKRMAEQAKKVAQNRKLIVHLLNQQANVKEFKKKIHTQARQYFELKRHLNRFKTVKLLTERAQKEWSSQKRQRFPSVSSGRAVSHKKNDFSRGHITQQSATYSGTGNEL